MASKEGWNYLAAVELVSCSFVLVNFVGCLWSCNQWIMQCTGTDCKAE